MSHYLTTEYLNFPTSTTMGKVPEPAALALLLIFPLRPYLLKLLRYAGHGELFTLAGLALALGGAQLFELVGIKGDLGALIIGVVLALVGLLTLLSLVSPQRSVPTGGLIRFLGQVIADLVQKNFQLCFGDFGGSKLRDLDGVLARLFSK